MKNTRGQTLVATLIVITIIAVLSVALWKGSGMFGAGGSSRKDGKGETIIGQTMYRARDEVCRSNLNQVRSSIQINTTVEDEHPATIQDLKLPAEFSVCPIGKEPYVYDPATGKVTCPHPGHEKY
ncbi:MAG: type II secretion system protein [Fimbriimonas sp.]